MDVHTPVFVAPSTIALQAHSQPRILHPNVEADTVFEVNVDASLQETESTPRPSQFVCWGMENGNSLSPMYNLWLEYCNEGESSKSTQSRVVFYATGVFSMSTWVQRTRSGVNKVVVVVTWWWWCQSMMQLHACCVLWPQIGNIVTWCQALISQREDVWLPSH